MLLGCGSFRRCSRLHLFDLFNKVRLLIIKLLILCEVCVWGGGEGSGPVGHVEKLSYIADLMAPLLASFPFPDSMALPLVPFPDSMALPLVPFPVLHIECMENWECTKL